MCCTREVFLGGIAWGGISWGPFGDGVTVAVAQCPALLSVLSHLLRSQES